MAKIKVNGVTRTFDIAFAINGFGKDRGKKMAVVILPELTDAFKVQAEWTLALQETAKGLEIPDYKAAAEYMMKNNPGWIVSHSEEGVSIGYNQKVLKRYG